MHSRKASKCVDISSQTGETNKKSLLTGDIHMQVSFILLYDSGGDTGQTRFAAVC